MSRSSRTLYVGNLPGDIREREVEDLFYKYGPVAHIDLKIPPRPPGYAFVEFEEARDAEDAIRGRDGYDFDGHRLRVELAHGGRGNSASIDRYSSYSSGRGPRGGVSRRSEYRVLVSGLPSSASWQDLKDHMRRAGDVCFSQVFRDGSGVWICFGIGLCLLSLAEMHRSCPMVSLCDLPGAQGTTGIVDYTNYDDMKYAIRKLDDSEFRNAFTRAIVRVREYKSSRSRSQSQSRSRSYSRSRSRSRSYSRGRSYSRSRSLSRSRSRRLDHSPKAKSAHRSLAKSRSRSASRSRSGSKPRSLSRYGCMRLSGDWIVGSWWDVVQVPATVVVVKYDVEEASRLLEHSCYKGLVDIKFGLFLELLQISIKIQISRTICNKFEYLKEGLPVEHPDRQKRMSESPKKHSSSRSRSKSVSRFDCG
ncbi:unnamed protein product [Camellia sinensis]